MSVFPNNRYYAQKQILETGDDSFISSIYIYIILVFLFYIQGTNLDTMDRHDEHNYIHVLPGFEPRLECDSGHCYLPRHREPVFSFSNLYFRFSTSSTVSRSYTVDIDQHIKGLKN